MASTAGMFPGPSIAMSTIPAPGTLRSERQQPNLHHLLSLCQARAVPRTRCGGRRGRGSAAGARVTGTRH